MSRSARAARGQVTIEYFMILTAVMLTTLFGFTAFDVDVREIIEDFYQHMVTVMGN